MYRLAKIRRGKLETWSMLGCTKDENENGPLSKKLRSKINDVS